jgi:alpha-1,3-glucan synthase
MIFPENDYDTENSFKFSDGNYTFQHRAFGADMFRYSWNFAKNWSEWQSWEDLSTIPASLFDTPENFWAGRHLVVQCMFYIW